MFGGYGDRIVYYDEGNDTVGVACEGKAVMFANAPTDEPGTAPDGAFDACREEYDAFYSDRLRTTAIVAGLWMVAGFIIRPFRRSDN